MLTKIKAKVQEIISTEARLMHKLGFKPNTVSFIGVVLGIFSGVTYWAAGATSTHIETYRIRIFLALLLLLFSGFCDALDGALARLYGETTVLGGFLDSLLDRYVDAAVLCGLILGGLCEPLWGLLALIGSLLTSYARARSEAAGIPMESIGLVERAERILIMAVASAINVILPETPSLNTGTIILALASNITVIQRTLYFSSRARPKAKVSSK
ncbi:CDP-alcohol phosphatidyltransferase family protein [Candidatus Bathyarchaeota archaeon]|nr:CDP-alcohol phosphatidyltransferase family protein [Candidatus Bathyarchaeota archaeon]